MPVTSGADAHLPVVLALDIGTSSTRSLLFDARGWAIEGTDCQLPFDLNASDAGGADVDADMLLELVFQTIDGTLGSWRQAIAAVGVSCFWHSVMGLDGSDRPTTPVFLWADTRSREDVDAIKRAYDPVDLWRRTGCFVHSSYWPGKLRWLRRTEPDAYRATKTWCAFSDYLHLRLFGERRTSVSMASSTAMQNATTLEWDDVVIDVAGIDAESLLPIGDSRESAGALGDAFARRWPALAKTPWFMAAGDGACANVGAGGIGPNRIALTIGTSGALRMVGPKPRGTDSATAPDLWTYRLDENRAVFGAAISNGGKVVEWFSELTGVSFEDVEIKQAAAMGPDAHGLTILPFLAGERAPIWSDWATATVTGMNLATTSADIIRASMESVTYRLGWIYRSLRERADGNHQIVANGGAVLRSPAWLQMLADVMEHPIVALPPEEESSARGAALLALEYAGLVGSLAEADDPVGYGRTIEPIAANSAIYHEAMDRQERLLSVLYQAGKPVV